MGCTPGASELGILALVVSNADGFGERGNGNAAGDDGIQEGGSACSPHGALGQERQL